MVQMIAIKEHITYMIISKVTIIECWTADKTWMENATINEKNDLMIAINIVTIEIEWHHVRCVDNVYIFYCYFSV